MHLRISLLEENELEINEQICRIQEISSVTNIL